MNGHVNQINYLAIELLERLGNIEPTELQIEKIESILSKVVPSQGVFDKEPILVEVISILLAKKDKISGEIAGLLEMSHRDSEDRHEGKKIS